MTSRDGLEKAPSGYLTWVLQPFERYLQGASFWRKLALPIFLALFAIGAVIGVGGVWAPKITAQKGDVTGLLLQRYKWANDAKLSLAEGRIYTALAAVETDALRAAFYRQVAADQLERAARNLSSLSTSSSKIEVIQSSTELARRIVGYAQLELLQDPVGGVHSPENLSTIVRALLRADITTVMQSLVESTEAEMKANGEEVIAARDWIFITFTIVAIGILSLVVWLVLHTQARRLVVSEKRIVTDQYNETSRILANMSHEVRTPLNAILGFSDLIASGIAGPTTQKQDEYLKDSMNAGKHLLSLINSVLELAKLESGRVNRNITHVDAIKISQNVISIMAHQALIKEVKLNGCFDEDLYIFADEQVIIQILMNLLSNAIKFTPSQGTVDLTVYGDGADVIFVVADSGVGMDEPTLAELGTPFFQAIPAGMTSSGTGLGISIVRALVKECNGSIIFESEIGVGTRATVRIPKQLYHAV